VVAAHQRLKATARKRQLERMVPVRLHGDNRVRTYVTLTQGRDGVGLGQVSSGASESVTY
jgi:hypothetical protein